MKYRNLTFRSFKLENYLKYTKSNFTLSIHHQNVATPCLLGALLSPLLLSLGRVRLLGKLLRACAAEWLDGWLAFGLLLLAAALSLDELFCVSPEYVICIQYSRTEKVKVH